VTSWVDPLKKCGKFSTISFITKNREPIHIALSNCI